MANPKHLAILKQGVAAWNKWRQENRETVPDLSGADLREAHLVGVDLIGANLAHTTLIGANLDRANLAHTTLVWANLAGVNLDRARLDAADLTGANLSGAHLIGAWLPVVNFHGTNLHGANLSEATIVVCMFDYIDLSAVKGLETVRHLGPSSIGIDTIYRSKGNIPEVFLRGVGVPEDFIVYMLSRVAKPVDFPCFISYSSQDQDFAERLHTELQGKGVRCWFAPEDLKISDRFQDRIEETLRVYDVLMVVLSANSVSSDWVEQEVQAAREKERREPGRTVLFPIRLDDAVMETDRAWAADIRRTRHIGDFRNWKDHDSFKKGFERLLRDLKPEASSAHLSFRSAAFQ